MKGIARTQKEIEFHDRVAALGCISCRQEGIFNPWVSIHHAHGRTKPGCHMWVLPLCEPHHQNNGTAIARHPYKRRWEARYGNEDDLIREMWAELGVEFTDPVRVAKPVDRNRPKKSTSEGVEVGIVKLREVKTKVEKPGNAKIKCVKPLHAKTKKPSTKKSRIASPAMPKAKIKNAGFSKKTLHQKKEKPVLSERQAAYVADQKEYLKTLRRKIAAKKREAAKDAGKTTSS